MNSLLQHVLTNFLLLYLAGMFLVWMFLVWGWVITQLIHHRRLSLPRFTGKRRTPRWGLGTMVLVFVVYNVVNLGVFYSYVLATGRTHRAGLQPEHAAAVETKENEPTKKGAPEEKSPQPPVPILKTNREDPILSVTEALFLLTLINEILIVAIPLLVKLTSGTRLIDLGVVPSNWSRQILIGAGGAFFIAPIVYAIQFLAVMIWTPNGHPVEDMIRNQFTLPIAYLAVLSAVVMAPVVEELLFRGLIQNWLLKLASRHEMREPMMAQEPTDETSPSEADSTAIAIPDRISSRRPALQAIVMTSAFFALVHFQQWPAPIPIFVLSVAIGTVYHLTGSLLASITMHATFNGISTLMLFWALLANPRDMPVKGPLPQTGMSGIFTPAMNWDRSRIPTPG